MDEKDNSSKENSITESIEAQFDDFFAPKKPEEVTDTEIKPPAADSPSVKKVPPKKTPQKPVDKKTAPDKAPVTKDEPSTSDKSTGKKTQQKFKPNKTLIEKKASSVKTVKKEDPVKQDLHVTQEKVSTEDSYEAPVQNVFKKANQEYKKIWIWEKVQQAISPFIFILLILLLVTVSLFNGMIMDSNGILGNFKIKDLSVPVPEPVSIKHTNRKSVTVLKDKKASSPEGSIEESKIEKSDVQHTVYIEEEAKIPASTKTIPLAKPADELTEVVKEEFLSYPYSIYLGSYNSVEKVEAASSTYKNKGITSYWIKLDLGKKGLWYRHFVGYFRSREEADEFIKARHIKEAESRQTKYTVLIGVYRSKEDLDNRKTRLEELGYSPYIISDSEEVYRLYTGAFYQRGRAEEFKDDLEANGIICELVER